MIFLPRILVYTNFHLVYEMYVLRKFHRKPSSHEPYCSVQAPQNVGQTLYFKFTLHKYEILDLPCLRTSKLDLPVAS